MGKKQNQPFLMSSYLYCENMNSCKKLLPLVALVAKKLLVKVRSIKNLNKLLKYVIKIKLLLPNLNLTFVW